VYKINKPDKTSRSPSLPDSEYDEATTNQFYTFLGELINIFIRK